MRRDETRVHVAWMARRVTDAGDAWHFGKACGEHGQRGRGAVPRLPMIGVDVLAEQGHLAHTRRRRAFRLRPDDVFDRAGEVSAPRV